MQDLRALVAAACNVPRHQKVIIMALEALGIVNVDAIAVMLSTAYTIESLAKMLAAHLVNKQIITTDVALVIECYFQRLCKLSPSLPMSSTSSPSSGGSRKRLKGEEASSSVSSSPEKALGVDWLPQLSTTHADFWHLLARCAWQTLPGAPGCPHKCEIDGAAQAPGQPHNLKRHLNSCHHGAVVPRARGGPVPVQPLPRAPVVAEIQHLHSIPPAALANIPAQWRALIPPPPPAAAAAAAPAAAAVALQPPQLMAPSLAPTPAPQQLVAPVADMELGADGAPSLHDLPYGSLAALLGAEPLQPPPPPPPQEQQLDFHMEPRLHGGT